MRPLTLTIFGITSNLAQIKLIPALYDIFAKGLLPKNTKIIGIARSQKTEDEFSDYLWDALHAENRHHQHPIKKEVFLRLCKSFHYTPGHIDDLNFYQGLKTLLLKLAPNGDRIFYLATYPDLYPQIFENLKLVGLTTQLKDRFSRLMIEKPIGTDLPSAKRLNQLLAKYFSEDQIFRLDHYLGKETLQNILTFRFGNELFSPLINKDFVDHIQITSAEDFGIGQRGGYYEMVGALKDVGQNHLLQMLTFTTMDAPQQFSNQAVTQERERVLKSLIPYPDKIIYGQYAGYLEEKNVSKASQMDTFFALKTELNNPTFKGVPIYIRSGKKLKETVTEVSIVFKVPINRLFKHLNCGDEPNVLIYRIQPNEGIVFKILTKKPGYQVELEPSFMQFCYRFDPHGHLLPDPYERLLVDAFLGDQTFFNDASEVEAAWAFIQRYKRSKPVIYRAGSWGPKEADQLIEADGREWLKPSMQFCSL